MTPLFGEEKPSLAAGPAAWLLGTGSRLHQKAFFLKAKAPRSVLREVLEAWKRMGALLPEPGQGLILFPWRPSLYKGCGSCRPRESDTLSGELAAKMGLGEEVSYWGAAGTRAQGLDLDPSPQTSGLLFDSGFLLHLSEPHRQEGHAVWVGCLSTVMDTALAQTPTAVPPSPPPKAGGALRAPLLL